MTDTPHRRLWWIGIALVSAIAGIIASTLVVEAMGRSERKTTSAAPVTPSATNFQPPSAGHAPAGTAALPAQTVFPAMPATGDATTKGTATPRRVEIRDGWFYVDGERFLIKGVGYSPARPGKLPWQERAPLALVDQDFAQIHEAGFNTIRTWTPLTPE